MVKACSNMLMVNSTKACGFRAGEMGLELILMRMGELSMGLGKMILYT